MPLRLVLRNILAHPLRSSMTTGSVILAVFLLCMLRAMVAGLSSTVEEASNKRLWVQSAVSLYVNLPLSYTSKIAAVDGAKMVTRHNWFGGIYQDESNFFGQFAVDPDTLLKSYPEMAIVEGSYQDFVSTRTGCIIGTDLAATYDWQVGDRIPLIGTIYPRLGGDAWEFTVSAIYGSSTPAIDRNRMYFQFDYLMEAIEVGDSVGDMEVGMFLIVVEDGHDATQVMADVDGLFENGPQRVQTTTDAEFNRQFVSMLGDIPLLLATIGGAVLFAIFFAVLNTMLMAGRERMRDVGIMKALGFTDGVVFATLLFEALFLCVIGGLLGLGAAVLAEDQVSRFIGPQLGGFEISATTMLMGMGIALGVGLLSGAVPGWLASRLHPVRALRMEA